MDSPRLQAAPGLNAPLVSARRAPSWLMGAAALAALTLVTHAANFGFVIVGGRLLAPADFGTLTALLGIVLLGMAPGMAVQSLTAAGALGGPVVVDARLARRLAVVIGAVVAATVVALGPRIGVDGLATVVAVTLAAVLLPLTNANEGLLQGRARFALLGVVMVVGAVAKFTMGLVGMAVVPATWIAAVAIAIGYLVQLTVSHRLSGGLRNPVDRAAVRPRLVSAVVMMGLLLALVHVDAVLAPMLLGDLDAGRYAVGVTGARVVFWAPQFAVLLLFPRLVTDHRYRVVVLALAGLALGGAVAALVATLAGPMLVDLVFGAEFVPIGDHLWRFAWMGTAAIGLQVLALSDLATGRRGAAWVLGGALVTVVGVLSLARPGTPSAVITTVAGIVTGFVALGMVARWIRGPSGRSGQDPTGAGTR